MHGCNAHCLLNLTSFSSIFDFTQSIACGESLDPKLHQIATVLEPTADAEPVTEGTILHTTRSGVQDEHKKIVRYRFATQS